MSQVLRNTSTCVMMLLVAQAAYSDTTKSPEADDSPKPLSVAPLDHVEYPESRPVWVSESPAIDEDSASFVVVSGPCDTPEESLEELEMMQRAAMATFIARVTDSGGAFDFYPISDEELDRNFVHRRYAGEVTQGDMTKYEHAVEIRVSDGKRRQIANAWRNLEVRDRLGALGILAFGGLVMLVSSSALLGLANRRVERREKARAIV